MEERIANREWHPLVPSDELQSELISQHQSKRDRTQLLKAQYRELPPSSEDKECPKKDLILRSENRHDGTWFPLVNQSYLMSD
jgi:hypothetical protein